MAEIDEIRQELEELQDIIPTQIQTGIPQNVKSQNIRSIHERSTEASLQILDVLESLNEADNVLEGFDDPNEVPPTEDYLPGFFYRRWVSTEFSQQPITFYIYTGVPELQWVQILNLTLPVKLYGTAANPNAVPLINTEDRIVGDLYIRTDTGESDGDILSVWIYLGFATGNKWIQLSDVEASAVLYTAQSLTNGQRIQAFRNLGKKTTIIDGNLHDFKKHPDNSGEGLEINDLAFNVMKERELMPVAKLVSGTGSSSADWEPLGSSIEF